MSSKNYHIDRSNYEEFFILYMDNELNADQMQMVEVFLAANPDLGGEMDLLLTTKLPVDEIAFPFKEALYSNRLHEEVVDENLLLYIDNELGADEKSKIEVKLKNDKEYQLAHTLLMQTKLDASEMIYYPNKKELYRHDEKVVVLTMWMRIAAAVVILFFSTLFIISSGDEASITNVVADNTPPKNDVQKIIPEPSTPATNENSLAVLKNDAIENIQPILPKNTAVNEPVELAVHQTQGSVENSHPEKVLSIPSLTSEQVITFNHALHHTINNSVVTSAMPGSYHITEDPQTADMEVEETKIRKGSLKGFLRRASRMIERNTGIGTVSIDDDELLIGAIAVKLK